jgi:subtilisin family serine protease
VLVPSPRSRPLHACAPIRALAVVTVAAVTLAGIAVAQPVPPDTAASYSSLSEAGASPPDAGAPSPSAVPGRLVVKLRSWVDAPIDRAFGAGRALAPATGSTLLDDLNRRHGVRGVRPLRRADAAIDSLAERRRLQTLRRARTAAARAARGRAAAAPAAMPDVTTIYVLDLSPWLDPERVAAEYAQDPAVEWAEPVREARVVLVPNDPFFASAGSWGQPFDDLWGVKRVSAPAAWDTARGAGTIVAVIDTGIDVAHPDIAANVWVNPGEIAGNGLDDDGNGYADDVHGWDFFGAADDADPFDDHGHGTHVAGTVAATGQNGLGVIGVAFESRVMALKGLDAGGGGFTDDLAEAIVYAAENGADVINASWGGIGVSQLIDDAIEVAHAAGVVFVAAAGNSNADVLAGPFFPAANPRAVTVAASDHLDQRAAFSNFGPRIDVTAPGGGGDGGPAFDSYRSILSLRSSGAGSSMTGNGKLVVGGNYLRQAGTSMAAPHVAGAAAVVLSAHPGYGPAAVRQALRAGADDVGPPGVDADSGFGRVNVAQAIAIDVLDTDLVTPGAGFLVTGDLVAVTGTAAGADFASYALDYGAGAFPTTWLPIAGPVTTPVQSGPLGTWDVSEVGDGTYTLRLRALNNAGVAFEARVTGTLDRLILTEPLSNTIRRPPPVLEVRGTAGGGGFLGYRVEWRTTGPDFQSGPWRADGIALAGGGTARVQDGLLATFDTAAITQSTDVDFRLVITTPAGERVEEMRHVILDPTLRPGWPRQVPGLPQFSTPRRLLHHTTVADLDGDGTKEIVVAYGETIHVWRHDGSYLPGWPRQLEGGTALSPFIRRVPAIADLDGDGLPEVVAAETEGRSAINAALGIGDTYVFHHDGTPMAGWPKTIHQAYGKDPNDLTRPGSPRGSFVLADVDGDGRRDIVAVVGPSLVVMDAQGNMLPGWPQRWPLVFPCVLSEYNCFEDLVAVGDVNGDGRMEIAAVTTDGDSNKSPHVLLLYDSLGRIMPGFPRKISKPRYGMAPGFSGHNRLGGYVNTPIMADLDGDGDLEIVALTTKTKLVAFHHDGKKARLKPGRVKGTTNKSCLGGAFPPLLEPPTAGDLDGDGLPEVVVSSHTTEWKWKPLGNGRISFSFCFPPTPGTDYVSVLRTRGLPPLAGWPVAFPFPRGDNTYGPGPLAIADLDGDLRPDLVSGSGLCGRWDTNFGLAGHRCFTIYALDAAGRVLPGFPKATPGPGSTPGTTPAIADLDGDGLKEIVWVDFFGNVLVWTVPGTPGPEVAEWPMFRHDPALTGARVPALGP